MDIQNIILIASLGSFIGSFMISICIYRNRTRIQEIDILGNCIIIKMASLSIRGLDNVSIGTETDGNNIV